MRSKLDEAPISTKYINQKIRMPGFVVPLDAVRNGQREFLLVPYFGACIHTPPPPANQIVLVTPHSKLNLSKPLEDDGSDLGGGRVERGQKQNSIRGVWLFVRSGTDLSLQSFAQFKKMKLNFQIE